MSLYDTNNQIFDYYKNNIPKKVDKDGNATNEPAVLVERFEGTPTIESIVQLNATDFNTPKAYFFRTGLSGTDTGTYILGISFLIVSVKGQTLDNGTYMQPQQINEEVISVLMGLTFKLSCANIKSLVEVKYENITSNNLTKETIQSALRFTQLKLAMDVLEIPIEVNQSVFDTIGTIELLPIDWIGIVNENTQNVQLKSPNNQTP